MGRVRVFGALVAATCLVVGGCSSSDGSSSDGASGTSSSEATSTATGSSGTASSGLCSAAEELRTSIGALTDVPVAEDGVAALRQAVTDVQDDVGRLADEARDEFADQVTRVEASADQLGTAIGALGSAPSASALAAVGTAVRSLAGEAGALLDDVSSSC